jgi:2'-5' RNA ligase
VNGNDPGGRSRSRRTFVAFDLDADAKTRLATETASLRGTLPGLAWVRPESVHLTVRFLGDTPEDALERLVPSLERAAAHCAFMDAALTGLRLLPTPRRPRVLALAVALPERAYALYGACEAAAREAGLPPEPRPFRPHCTLARFRKPVVLKGLPETRWGETQLRELTLFESHLGPGGSVYATLKTFPLAAS